MLFLNGNTFYDNKSENDKKSWELTNEEIKTIDSSKQINEEENTNTMDSTENNREI